MDVYWRSLMASRFGPQKKDWLAANEAGQKTWTAEFAADKARPRPITEETHEGKDATERPARLRAEEARRRPGTENRAQRDSAKLQQAWDEDDKENRGGRSDGPPTQEALLTDRRGLPAPPAPWCGA